MKYVIGDVLGGKYRVLDGEEELPDSLHSYHEELLRRLGVGDLQAVVTPLAAILATAYEPLSVRELVAILVHRKLLTEEGARQMVEKGLAAIASMVRSAPDPEGEVGYCLFHQSLRDHMTGSDQMTHSIATAREAFADLAEQEKVPEVIRNYVFRCGIKHLIEQNRLEKAIEWMTSFEYTMKRFQTLDFTGLAPEGWYSDWELLATGGKFSGDCEIWWDFARTNRHHFRKAGWESWRVFFQAAMDHSDDSPVTQEAEKYYSDGKCDWYWLRWNNRPKVFNESPLISVLDGHEGRVNGVKELRDGRIVSWSDDSTIRLWDCNAGNFNEIMSGHTDKVSGVIALLDGRILSWSNDSTLRIWKGNVSGGVFQGHDSKVNGAYELISRYILSWAGKTLHIWDNKSFDCILVFQGHTEEVSGAKELLDGKILSWSSGQKDNTFRIWDSKSGHCKAVFKGHDSPIIGAEELSCSRILSWSSDSVGAIWGGRVIANYGSIQMWSAKTGEFLSEFIGHSGAVIGAKELSDDRILSWSYDETLRIWSAKTGECLSELKGHKGTVRGAKELSDGRILSWSGDKTIRIWNEENGDVVSSVKCGGWFRGVKELKDRRLISWSDDKIIRIWDEQNLDCVAIFQGHTKKISGAKELLDGKILSWSFDATLRIWDGRSRIKVENLETHATAKIKLILSNENIVSSSTEDINTLSLWNGKSGFLIAEMKHSDQRTKLTEVKQLANGRIVSFSHATICLWNETNGDCVTVLKTPHTGGLGGIEELSEGGLVTWANDGTICFWDSENGDCIAILEGHDKQVFGVKELSDGRILSWSRDKTLQLWEGQTGKNLKVLKGHIGPVDKAQLLSHDRILSWSSQLDEKGIVDKALRIWSAKTGECLSVLKGHESFVCGAKVLSDDRILSWSRDKTLRIWSAKTGECLSELKGHKGHVYGAKVLSDGRILSWSGDKTLRIWSAKTGECLSELIGHTSPVTEVTELSDGRILSWSAWSRSNNSSTPFPLYADKTLRLWHGINNEHCYIIEGPTDYSEAILKFGKIFFTQNASTYFLEYGNLQQRTCANKINFQQLINPNKIDD